MPTTLHVERHFTGKEIVRDVVIGMADGLTVPFALAAGLSGAVKSTNVVVIAGLAEIAAGSIAMGLGGYLAARSDAEHYDSEREREVREVRELPDEEEREVREVLHEWGMAPEESGPVVQALRKRPTAWVDFMMRFELGLEKPDPGRAVRSAGTIATSYVVGGLIPLFPYMVIHQANQALDAQRGGDVDSAGSVWVCEGAVHGIGAASKRVTDSCDRCTCGRSGFFASTNYLVSILFSKTYLTFPGGQK